MDTNSNRPVEIDGIKMCCHTCDNFFCPNGVCELHGEEHDISDICSDWKYGKLNRKQCKPGIIFLDIDGVLNRVEDETSYLVLKPDTYGLSATLVERLEYLVDKTGAKIVISSNWRKFADDGCWSCHRMSFRNPLPIVKGIFGDTIIGSTPDLPHQNKARCVNQWLSTYHQSVGGGKFVIFDDDDRQGFGDDPVLAERWIHTRQEVGLTDEDITKALTLLAD